MNELIRVRLDTGKYLTVTSAEFLALSVKGRVLSYEIVRDEEEWTIDSPE